jgi:hypothetical protein
MLLNGFVTGLFAGLIAGKRGKLVAGIAQFLPLILFVALELVINRDLSSYFGQYGLQFWTWIGLVPAIIGGHYGAKIIREIMAETDIDLENVGDDDKLPSNQREDETTEPEQNKNQGSYDSSTGPEVLKNPYTEYHEDWLLQCPKCQWSGMAKDGAIRDYSTLFDISCPKCFEMLLLVPYPTDEQTKEAAANGNKEALAEMHNVLHRKRFQASLEINKLKTPDQLPDLTGDSLEFICAISTDDMTPADVVIKHGDTVLWQEPEQYEWWDRFNAIKAILKEKYGSRFKSFTPTPRARYSLFGDRLNSQTYISFD